MAKAFLDSLEINGFRTFKHLKIDELRRVNLIVGTNSVGKTSLLEAVQLLIAEGSSDLMIDILIKRNEGIGLFELMRGIGSRAEEEERLEIIRESLGYLFYGRPDLYSDYSRHEFSIRSLKNFNQQLHVRATWFDEAEFVETVSSSDGVAAKRRRIQLVENHYIQTQLPILESNSVDTMIEQAILGLAIQVNQQKPQNIALDRYFRRLRRSSQTVANPKFNYIGVEGVSDSELSAYWSAIVLTKSEKDVIDAIKIISPDVERFAFLDYENSRRKYPIVRLKGVQKRVPFLSLGEGANRILGVILALVNSQNGVLLIDEIDTGLHHSIQVKVWEFIFRLAKQLNVQIFATTHSQDALYAFEKVANRNLGVSQLVRLSNWQGNTYASLVDEQEMKVALEDSIELRGTS